ncbi:putative vacuolar protein sorting-associated protein 13A [Dichanthelium oligosanthes]|uniref:Putative vacuolar protein sorting-associated protein 13A n=1 Tax=Dichanthelium oligosanthes TaxID=888268 RepID=A0A1E5VQT9_9POAL|nr:putative vacuolar protein sorting-associated protein 13A [Dichanthelium oligosanthes]
MFEGLVSQVLDGLLRRYVRGIQKEQLKIGIWNVSSLIGLRGFMCSWRIVQCYSYFCFPSLSDKEILLENVELILEAFDYLQLPFALKNGRIGKLSIRIPWKKLGWDPIIIVIEDVFWSSDSLDKRELAGKLAKLNAIELAKFSRRVTDNQTGQSFLSYISAKILDNIQVSMRNFHIVYMDTHNDQGNFVFGLEFSSLSIQTDTQKQSFTMSLMARSRQDEVNKIIEISDVGIYCHQLEEQQDLCHVGALGNGHSRDDYLVNPFSVTVSVLANKAAKLDGAPQYDMTMELTALALSVDEIQLQQILNLWDYFTICALRTKYGRYRPSQISLSKRGKGWQRMWWHYAQNSVLADVRRRLKKTSWRYLRERLNYRLGYVKLYRMKLELLQKGQIVSKDILQELENMDKECDIDDILNYRTIAEQKLQESLVKSTKDTSNPGSPRTDEQPAGASRGWLNWLSLGMLGAGGTADSSSFAGVISEDIIKCSTGDGLGAPVISIQVDFPKSNQGSEASTRVVVQEFSAIYEPEFFINVLHIYDLFSSFQFQHDRVLSSLNRFDNLGARLVSKLKYMFANRKKLIWDLRIHHFAIKLPSQNCERKELTMVVEAGDVFIQSKDIFEEVSRTQESNSFLDQISKSLPSCFSDDLLLGIQLDELYNHFEVGVTGFQVKVLLPDTHNVSSTLIKLDASVALRLCVLLDEPVLKQLEVGFIVPFIDIYLSQTMYSAIVNLPRAEETNLVRNSMFDNAKTHGPKKLPLNMSVSLKLAKLGLQVDLDGNYEESSCVIVGVEDIDIRYAICKLSDLSLAMKTVNITSNNRKDESDSHVLCLSGNLTQCPKNSVEACLNLHYRTHKHDDQIHHVYRLNLHDVDLHVNPSVIGQIRMFLINLDSGPSVGSDVESAMIGQGSMKSGATNGILPKFSLSNLCGADGTLFAGISVDHFPFLDTDYTCGYSFGRLGTQDVQPQESSNARNEQCHDSSGLNGYHFSDLGSNSLCKTQHSNCSSTSPNNPKNVSRTVLDLSLVSVRVHFPESCGTLATITIPESIATLTFFGASSWDLLLSANNLTLASPWTPPNVHELLWGTSSHHNASVLNVRVKKDLPALSTEVCVGIQNVCCVLPSKLLAMFIGFFLLDDWNPIAKQEHPVAGNNLECVGESQDCITYKFEICDCVVIFPVEEQDFFCLKLGVPHFFCEFIATGSSVEFGKRIPKEFFSSECIVSSRVDVISIYARNASISLLFVSEQANFILKLDENIPKRIHSLIEKFDAGIWIQVPCSQQPTLPTSIMSKMSQCNLLAEDLYFMNGMETVIGVVDQLISISKESKMYDGNALQFLEHRSLNEGGNPDPNECTNITISIKDLMILLGHSKDKDLALERIATANLEFDVSAVLVGEKPEHINFEIISLALQSTGGYTLISIVPDGPLSPVFIKFTKHHAGQDEIFLSLPLFEVWLYLEDWNTIINHFHSYVKKMGDSLPMEHPAALPQFPETTSSPFMTTEFGSPDDSNLVVTCETIAGVVHIPIWEKEENHTSNHMGGTPSSFSMQVSTHHEADDIQYHEPKGCKFVTLTFESKHFVVMSGDSCMNFKCDLERMKIMLEMIQENKGTSVPFLHISKVKSSGYIHQSERGLEHISADLQAEYMDVSLSHQIFSFWRNMELKFPAASSSASSFYTVTFKAGLRKGSLLLNDGRWSSHGPVIETLLKNLTVQFSQMKDQTEVSAFVDLLVNYNNIDKVMWEPFIEPSRFQLNMLRKCADYALDISPSTDVCLSSSKQLNLNISEPLIEAIIRLGQMITDSLDPSNGGGLREDPGILRLSHDDVRTRRYAPYILSNDTSLPVRFKVYRGAVNSDDIDSFSVIDENSVPAGQAVPIYVEETLDEFFFQHREARSSEHLIEKRMSTVSHYMISIEFDGTSGPSKPMSMDLVGIYFFEVNFSSSKKPIIGEESLGAFSSNRKVNDGLIVPVVLDVSLQNYSKRIRVYSTVILSNETSMPLELRFDIPFGVSSKVIGPIPPNKEIPLPVHLSEAGQIRWHPVGRTYLWSETRSLSSLLSRESRVGFMKSSVCYPAHPSNDPFRCCVSVEEYNVPSSISTRKGQFCSERLNAQPVPGSSSPNNSKQSLTRTHFIRHVRLNTPLLIKNYLPVCISLTIDNGGSARVVSLKEVGSASIFSVDPSNDLGITIDIEDYRSLVIKFPRAESFSSAAKSNGFKFSTTETITFYSNLSNSSLNVMLEKSMDARSGARELYLSVPFLLYNCTDLLLTITESSYERSGSTLVIPPSFELDGHARHLLEKNGLSLVDVSVQRFAAKMPQLDLMDGSSSEISCTNNSESVKKEFDKEVKAYMFAPDGHTPATELSVKELLVSIRFDGPGWQWSGSFFPDHLGDAQLKMRNSASGVSYMVRVEVQNADLDVRSKKVSGRNNINTGTVLILLSDDKTGFVPYRIDNFSMEKLRIYQQRCESIETIVYPYTSCQYAWDEPCYPHRLTVEIPGERSLGTFNLDILNDDVHVSLSSTSEKVERKFCISVHAEGAIKVLSVIDSNCHNTETKEKDFLGSKEPKVADQKLEFEMNFAEVINIHIPFIGISLISSSPQELLFASAKEMTIVAMQSLDQQRFTVEIQSMQIDNQFPDSPHPVMLSFEGSQKGKSMNFFKSKDTKLRSANDSLSNTTEPVLRFAAAKWRTRDVSFVSYQCINISVAPVRLELEERLVLSMIEYFRSVSSRINLGHLEKSLELSILGGATDMLREYEKISKHLSDEPLVQDCELLPSVIPVGAPWQQIHLLARKQKKRGFMALLDVEGVPVYLGEIMVENLMASWQSVQDILVRHYSRQILHELYKVFGSAGVIGNPMGFARNVGFGLKDFISASRKGKLQSPVELLNGLAQGSKTLIGSTVYAVSSATSHFSKTAYKGLVAFTYDEQAASKMEERERQLGLHGEGVLNGFLEGLTGLLQSPIRGAEKHGLPGVISGLAMGTAGLVARPMASILEATGRTAQSIRNRSNPHESNCLRVRFPRPVARDRPLFPYSWEEAIGMSLLAQADVGRLKEETFVMCKTLKEPGKFLVLTEKLLLLVSSPYLVDLGSPQFVGVPPDPQWLIDMEMHLKSIVHLDRSLEVVNIVGSNGETSPRDKRGGARNRVMSSAFVPLFHLSIELPNVEDAEGTLQVLEALIEKGMVRRWDKNILHRSNISRGF